uniref:Uncharacterized protein n=1 Tax=Anguilla anguilla TaxID=7936 RepID=A0A0E9P8G4_ANGAN
MDFTGLLSPASASQ